MYKGLLGLSLVTYLTTQKGRKVVLSYSAKLEELYEPFFLN